MNEYVTGEPMAPTRRTSPHRPRVLLVEDEAIIALDLSLTLQSVGYEVLGPCRSIGEALDAVGRLHPDVAMLDIDLGEGARGFELGNALHDADIPFLFVSSHTPTELPTPVVLRDHPRLVKPVDARRLLTEIEALLRG